MVTNNGFFKAVGVYLARYKQAKLSIFIVKNQLSWIATMQTTESYSLGWLFLVANQDVQILAFEETRLFLLVSL